MFHACCRCCLLAVSMSVFICSWEQVDPVITLTVVGLKSSSTSLTYEFCETHRKMHTLVHFELMDCGLVPEELLSIASDTGAADFKEVLRASYPAAYALHSLRIDKE